MIDGITFFGSYYEAISEDLSPEEQGVVYKAIMDYAFAGIEPDLTGAARMAFRLIKPNIDASIKRRNASKINGSKGGRPTEKKPKQNLAKTRRLSNEKTYAKPDKEKDKEKDKDKGVGEKEKTPTESKRKRAEGVMEAYNMICTSLPKARSLTEQRIRHVNARLEEYSPDDMRTVFDKAQASRFLSGKVKEWRADFDWLINANNFVKVLEGRYDDRDPLQSTYEQDMAEILQGADPEELARAERILT